MIYFGLIFFGLVILGNFVNKDIWTFNYKELTTSGCPLKSRQYATPTESPRVDRG